jgi:signal peptidase I
MEPELQRGDYNLVDHRAVLAGTWKRGDVVIFDSPPTWTGEGSVLVKRIIGMPGERVSLYRGRVFINDRPLDEPYLFKPLEIEEDMPAVVIGNGEYFMMGDNRDHSDDSRDNGPVEENYIRGRILSRLWPPSRFGGIQAPVYNVK